MLVPAVIAPVLALAVAATVTFIVYRRIRHRDPDETRRSFRVGQVAEDDGRHHARPHRQRQLGQGADVPVWVVVSAATAIALGTYLGGWRIIRTLGHGVTKLETPQAFSAETSSAVVILARTSRAR